MEDVLIAPPHVDDVFFMGGSPKRAKTVRVIKSDDGSVQVFEDEKVMEFEIQEKAEKENK